MKWIDLLKITSNNPVFNTGFLSSMEDPKYIRVQLNRWINQKKIIKLKKGHYMINKPYINEFPWKFHIANFLNQPSYISLESALGFYSLIPEYIPSITSITTGRSGKITNLLGTFIYRHVKGSLFFGYTKIKMKEEAFIAEKEKALIDLFYFNKISKEYIKELRLQNLDTIDFEKLEIYAKKTGKKKILYAVSLLKEFL